MRALANRLGHSATTTRPTSRNLPRTLPPSQYFSSERADRIDQVLRLWRFRRVVTCGLLGGDFHMRVGRHQFVGDRHAFHDLDALAASARSCFISLMETKRSMRLRPSQWITSGINCWKRASCTPATHSVRSKYCAAASPPSWRLRALYTRNLVTSPSARPSVAIVDDDAETRRFGRRARAFLDAVQQIRPAGADIRAEYVGAVALVMHAAGDAGAVVRQFADVARTDRPSCRPIGGRNTCRSGRVTSSGNMPAVCSNNCRRKLFSVVAKRCAMPGRYQTGSIAILTTETAAALVHDLVVHLEPAGLRLRTSVPADQDGRGVIAMLGRISIPSAISFPKFSAARCPPRIQRDDFLRDRSIAGTARSSRQGGYW